MFCACSITYFFLSSLFLSLYIINNFYHYISSWTTCTCIHFHLKLNEYFFHSYISHILKCIVKIATTIFFCYRLMEEAYVMKDPFTEERGFITLGSSCSICKSLVCLSQVLQYCSLYFPSA